MKNKEAIDTIIHFDKYITPCDEYGYLLRGELVDAISMAVDALRGQTPQNPRKVARLFSDGRIRYNDYYCPSCGKQQKVGYGKRRVENGWFCERCGQKLTWLEVDE